MSITLNTLARENRSVLGILAQLVECCKDACRGRWFESTGCLIRCVKLLYLKVIECSEMVQKVWYSHLAENFYYSRSFENQSP